MERGPPPKGWLNSGEESGLFFFFFKAALRGIGYGGRSHAAFLITLYRFGAQREEGVRL